MIFNKRYPISMVWVDLDDTIIDFATNSRAALERLYRTGGLSRWWEQPAGWINDYELHNHALWARYNIGEISRDYLRMERFAMPLVNAGMPRPQAEEMSRRFDPLYLDYLAQEKHLMPGAMALLRHIKKCGARIGVLSNGFKEVQYRKMDTAGVSPWVDCTVLSDDIGVNKPDIRIFRYAMQQSGVPDPGLHLMIGDNPTTDIQGAMCAGWHAVHYRPARAAEAGVSAAQGCIVAADLDEISALLS